jgi:Fe-S cluster biogenesis protein NfuA
MCAIVVPMPLSEEAFTALVDGGCDGCGVKKLTVLAIVGERLPLLNGEIFGEPSWGYKGEDLVRGTYRIVCNGCEKELFVSTSCPQCDASDGIGRALERENAFPLPRACAGCGSRQLTAHALVPARITYDGTRASKARTLTLPEDAGFHAFRIECKGCRAVVESAERCPLCGDR